MAVKIAIMIRHDDSHHNTHPTSLRINVGDPWLIRQTTKHRQNGRSFSLSHPFQRACP